MIELSRRRCRDLTEEGKYEEAVYESEVCGQWYDRITGRSSDE